MSLRALKVKNYKKAKNKLKKHVIIIMMTILNKSEYLYLTISFNNLFHWNTNNMKQTIIFFGFEHNN